MFGLVASGTTATMKSKKSTLKSRSSSQNRKQQFIISRGRLELWNVNMATSFYNGVQQREQWKHRGQVRVIYMEFALPSISQQQLAGPAVASTRHFFRMCFVL